MTRIQFIKKHCDVCGYPGCHGPGSKLFDGCPFKCELDGHICSSYHEEVRTRYLSDFEQGVRQMLKWSSNNYSGIISTIQDMIVHDCRSNQEIIDYLVGVCNWPKDDAWELLHHALTELMNMCEERLVF